MEKKQSSSQPTGVINFSVFRHDNQIEAIYIKLREGKVSKSKEIGVYGEAVVDLDKNGNAVGIEMLEPVGGHFKIGHLGALSKCATFKT